MYYYDTDDWIRGYLTEGEYVKWTGRPGKGITFRLEYLFFIPFMAVWTGGVVSATVSALANILGGDDDYFLLLFLVPFWAAGIFFNYVLFIRPLIRRRSVRYALTNFYVYEYFRGNVKTVSLDAHPAVRVSKANRHGRGTVTVGDTGTYGLNGWMIDVPGYIELLNVDDPQKVYGMIVEQNHFRE